MEKTKKITIEIWGGFHNQMTPIRVRVPEWAPDEGINYCLDCLSDSTRKRVMRHMCGHKDCLCGPHHGWQWEVV